MINKFRIRFFHRDSKLENYNPWNEHQIICDNFEVIKIYLSSILSITSRINSKPLTHLMIDQNSIKIKNYNN